jgi:hypothetical protein
VRAERPGSSLGVGCACRASSSRRARDAAFASAHAPAAPRRLGGSPGACAETTDERDVDVIVPVYDGVEQTRRCLESVRRSPQRTAFELVLVDDATPRREIAGLLDALAREGA